MARFDIISKDGSTVRYSGKPRYNGAYLKPSYIEFSEIASPIPIAWEVGDYIDYPRTGMRYRLYSVPQPSKNARKGSHGRAFTYSNVQLYAATKELEITPFRDLVDADFSTSPDVITFEDVHGIARRIQACMDDLYPGRWDIRVADFDETTDSEIVENITTAKDFALSGGTCLDALSKIYELWQDVGWVHTNENGKEVIIIGYPNKRIAANTSDAFLYGKGNGLTAIKKNQTNTEEFATRLYVYGSERNLPARYYNGKSILNAESVDIRNLMIPLDSWGKTDGLPDARKAYLENAEAVAKYGVIPKTHYFDSDDAGANIFPTISGMTIGMIRKGLDSLGQSDSAYYPTTSNYTDDSLRVDKVRYCQNPTDDGSITDVALQEYAAPYGGKTRGVAVPSGSVSVNIIDSELLASHSFSLSKAKSCKVVFAPYISGHVVDDGFEGVNVKLTFRDSSTSAHTASSVIIPATNKDGKWSFNIPNISYDYAQSPRTGFAAYIYLTITVRLASGNETVSIQYTLDAGTTTFSLYAVSDKTFLLRLHEIGFDINNQSSLGNGKAVSMKTGMCAGRTFMIDSCRHKSASGYWDFTVRRQKDKTLGLMFPNSSYPIAAEDEFVLVDIAMPELYILVNSQKLLTEGQKFLSRASKIQNRYEPSIDAKVMAESGRTIREGMFMEISDEDVVDGGTDYILIETLSICEDESSIPTYKVTLRKKRKVSYKGTPSATSENETSSVEDDKESVSGGEVDLTGYATENWVLEKKYAADSDLQILSALLSSMWHLDAEGNVCTDRNVIIAGDTSSGGEGEDTPAGINEEQLQAYLDAHKYVTEDDVAGLIPDVDLSDYYTKSQTDSAISTAIAGIDLSPYATKTDVNTAIANLINGAPTTLDTLKEIADALAENEDVVDALESAIGTKANASDLAALKGSHEALKGDFEALETTVGNIGNTVTGHTSSIGSNASAISVLQGYFADGIAKKATADASGNVITSTYATVTALNAVSNRVTTLESWKTELSKYITIVDGNVKISTNLIVTGDTSSGGSGEDTPAAGTVTGIKVNGSTYSPVAGIVTIPDYPTSLTWSAISGKPSFATVATSGSYNDLLNKPTIPTALKNPTALSWSGYSSGSYDGSAAKSITIPSNTSQLTNGAGFITGITKTMVATALGAATAGRYLLDTGGDVSWGIIPTRLSQFTDDVVSGKYLPLSGGTISGVVTISPTNTSGRQDGIILHDKGGGHGESLSLKWTSASYATGNSLYPNPTYSQLIYNNGTTEYTLIHSGNIGSYNAGSATKLQTARMIWGQSFDGTGDVTGVATFSNGVNASTIVADANILTKGNLILNTSATSLSTSGVICFGFYGKQLSSNFLTSFRTSMFGDSNTGTKFRVARTDVTIESLCARYGNALAWSSGDTNGYLAVSYEAGISGAYIGGGNDDKLNWHAKLFHNKMNLIPNAAAAYTLGTSSYRWSTVYGVNGDFSGNVSPSVNGNGSLGTTSSYWGYVYSNIGMFGDSVTVRNGIECGSDLDVGGNAIIAGDTSSGSDIRFKDVIENKRIKIEDIAHAPLFTFKWNNREDDTVHLGSSAQYWEKVAPWLVSGEDFKSLNYAVLGVAMGISLAKHETEQDKEIKALKRKVKDLEIKIRRMEYGSR